MSHSIEFDTSKDELIVIAYYLNNLYSAFESIFRNVATTFENSIDSASGWHSQLLERMSLDLRPLRPNLITESTLPALDELRRFRHLFRHAYVIRLDARRLRLVWENAIEIRQEMDENLAKFLQFLNSLD